MTEKEKLPDVHQISEEPLGLIHEIYQFPSFVFVFAFVFVSVFVFVFVFVFAFVFVFVCILGFSAFLPQPLLFCAWGLLARMATKESVFRG